MSRRKEQKARARAERAARERARRRRLLAIALAGAAAVAAVLIGVSRIGQGTERSTEAGVAGAAETARLLAGVPQAETRLGDPDAPALVEFVDLQCPFCRQFTLEVLPTLVRRYVRPGKLRLELRILRFIGPDSDRAARAALAAGRQDRLWHFVDLFFRNQGAENSGYATDAFLQALAGAVPRLDAEAVMRDRDEASIEQSLRGFEAEARRHGIRSTPSFLLVRPGEPPRPLAAESLTPEAFTGPLDAYLAGR